MEKEVVVICFCFRFFGGGGIVLFDLLLCSVSFCFVVFSVVLYGLALFLHCFVWLYFGFL